MADLLPEPMVLVRPEGTIEAANLAFTSTFGWSVDELAGLSLAELVCAPRTALAAYLTHCAATSHFLPAALTLRHRDATEVSCRVEGAAFHPPGDVTERLALLRLIRGESAGARFVDLTQQIGDLSEEIVRRRRAERTAEDALDRERRVRERLTALTEASGTLVASLAVRDVLPAIGELAERLIPADAHAVWQCDRETGAWRTIWQRGLSDSFVTAILNRRGPAGAASPLTDPLFVEDVERVPLLTERRAVYAAEGIRSLSAIPLLVDGGGSYGTVVAYYREQNAIGVDDRRVATALCNLASSALTMATLYEAESASRMAAEEAERRAAFLAKASAALADSLDYEATLEAVVEFAVPAIADMCAADISSEGGELKRLAAAHRDPSKLEIARTLYERYPQDPRSPYGIAHAMRTAKSMLMPRIAAESIAAYGRDPEHLRLVQALAITSYMCVPLVVRGRALGVLTFVSAESGREYTEADLRLAEEVASRAALAVENARAYQDARRANQVKDEFLATLSHELRTPLNAVLGYARMLRAGILTGEKQARAVEVLERNAGSLNQIVEDVLDVSRIVAGKIRLNIERVDLSLVLQDAAATVLPAAEVRGVRVEAGLDVPSHPVSGDHDRLQQVVWNLLSNAVKFTPRGGRVQLRLEPLESHMQIVVSDTGMGIRPDFLPFLFEPFRQADSGFSREHGGLGLGLSIARQIVELHGGTIAATSEGEGRGSTFVVQLPMMAEQRDSQPRRRRPHRNASRIEPPHTRSRQLEGIRVLAVDDDADALMLVAEIMKSAGAEISTANSGQAALDRLERPERPHILLTDIGMPGMDGFELISRIRQAGSPGRDLPAIALTAYARSDDRTRLLASGYQMYLAKPVSPSELIFAIRALAAGPGSIGPQV